MSINLHTSPKNSVPQSLLDAWRKVPVSVVVDLDESIRQIDPAIRPLRVAGTQPALFGRAVTVQCEPPDFGAVLHAIDAVGEGDVLVIAAGGFPHNAMIGDILCGQLRAKGAAGIVCDGAIRDVGTLGRWTDFSVYSRSVTPRGPVGAAHGSINGPVMIADIEIHPGDLIIGDDDGLVALSGQDLEAWIVAAETRIKTEETWAVRLANGETVGEVFDLK